MSNSMDAPRLRAAAFAALILVLASSAAASAQNKPRFTFQIGPALVVHPAGKTNHRVRPAVSGIAAGASAALGIELTPAFGIDVEADVERSVSTSQRFSYTWREDYVAESRDTLLTANVRWRQGSALEVFAGGGLAVSKFANRSIVRTNFFPAATIAEPDEEETSYRPALSAGVGFILPVSQRVELVPSVTARYVHRASLYGLGAYMGAGRRAFQIGASLRFK